MAKLMLLIQVMLPSSYIYFFGCNIYFSSVIHSFHISIAIVPVDFIKFFGSGDEKFQGFGKDDSQMDMLKGNHMHDSSEHTMTLMNVTCPGELVVGVATNVYTKNALN